MYYVKFLLFGLYFNIINSQPNENIVLNSNYRQNNAENSSMDAIGSVVNVINEYLTQMYGGQPTPDDDACKTSLYNISGVEIKISSRPRGSCSYCCPITNLLKYVNLYFTNKARGGKLVKLKPIRKKGMLRSAGFDANLPTVINVHGFTEDGLGFLNKATLNAYLSRKEDTNIILVDWSELSPFPWYPQTMEHVKNVGMLLGKFVKFYNSTGELQIAKLHLIGFSLGAHMVSFIGKAVGDVQKIPRITGLDPAFPLFSMEDSSQRLSKRDAEYVDVIHTDGGKFGFPTSLGHADFYPNGGTYIQPGCELSDLAENKGLQYFGWCSHARAVFFYAESVRNPNSFPATEYDVRGMKSGFKRRRRVSDVYMGFSANKTYAVGRFYLTTNSHQPFGKSMQAQEIDMKNANLTNR